MNVSSLFGRPVGVCLLPSGHQVLQREMLRPYVSDEADLQGAQAILIPEEGDGLVHMKRDPPLPGWYGRRSKEDLPQDIKE